MKIKGEEFEVGEVSVFEHRLAALAAGGEEQAKDKQYTRLFEIDFETLSFDEQESSQQRDGNGIPEEQNGFGSRPVVHQRFCEERIQAVGNAGNDAGRIADQGVPAEFCHFLSLRIGLYLFRC